MIKILALIVVVLTVITIARIIRILELVSKLSPENEVETAKKDNKFNAVMMLLFLVFGMAGAVFTIVTLRHSMLPVSASEHGVAIDNLMNTTYAVIGIVFVITHVFLFWYAYKYQFKKDKKALFYPENHRLELIWTIIPTIVLTCLIVYGLKTWNKIMDKASPDAMVIQIYAKQFDWTVRYAGKDNVLGKSNFRLIKGANILGMDSTDKNGFDDIITKELHFPVGKPILLKFNSRDVIHSAYLPHFRVQMNLVPGMTTRFGFTPTITTEKMKKITKNPKFEYVLLCNKICGIAHYTMKMNVVVESETEYNEWLSKQSPYYAAPVPAADSTAKKPVAMVEVKK